MIILAIDTSCGVCSIALYNGDLLKEEIILDLHKQAGQSAHLITNLLSDCDLKITDIDAIAVTIGPGSFTGIRIGISLAQGIAAVTNKPICSITSLEAIAQHKSGTFTAIIDAGKNEVYAQSFKDNKPQSEITLARPEQLDLNSCIGVYLDKKDYPFARFVAQIAYAKLNDPAYIEEELTPLYIREPDAVVKINATKHST